MSTLLRERVATLAPQLTQEEIDRVLQEMDEHQTSQEGETPTSLLGVEFQASTLSSFLLTTPDSELVPLHELVLFLCATDIRTPNDNFTFLFELTRSLSHLERTPTNSSIIAAANDLLAWLRLESEERRI